ncbi:MAG: ATP-binding protein, partial [Bacillota bacterium]|nr:ATP-binding protein [Bacillota bacterium]
REEQIYTFDEKPSSRLEEKLSYACQLLSENNVGIAIYSVPDLTLLKANQLYLSFLNASFNSPCKTFGRNIYDFISGYKGSPAEQLLENAIATGKSQCLGVFQCDRSEKGITYWNRMSTPVKEGGRVKYLITNVHEVTELVVNERKIQVQEELFRNQKEQLEAILDNMQEAILVFDKDDNYILANKLARQHFKTRLQKVGDSRKETEYYDLNGRKIPSEEMPFYRVKHFEIVKDMILYFRLGEEEFYSLVNGTPVFDEDNRFLYGIISTRSITEFIRSQQELSEIQLKLFKTEQEKREVLEKAIEMKDEFLSLVSHELRTPLNVISTAVQAINYLCKEDLSDKAAKYIGMIRQNANRQLRLVNNLLDITRANAGRINVNRKNIDAVFLTKSITESVQSYASQKGIHLAFESSLTKLMIATDDEKYERILLNLLSNAIKFTPGGKWVRVRLSIENGNTCIEVKDEGIGIPEDKIDLIFERFGQVNSILSRQAEGAGIGLSLVKKFVEALGGEISVKSTFGKGTTFTILLPADTQINEYEEKPVMDLMDNRLVEISTVEFSDIYL